MSHATIACSSNLFNRPTVIGLHCCGVPAILVYVYCVDVYL